MTTNILAPASDELHTILSNQRSAFLHDGPPILYEQGSWNGMDLLHAPFTKNTDRLINLFLR